MYGTGVTDLVPFLPRRFPSTSVPPQVPGQPRVRRPLDIVALRVHSGRGFGPKRVLLGLLLDAVSRREVLGEEKRGTLPRGSVTPGDRSHHRGGTRPSQRRIHDRGVGTTLGEFQFRNTEIVGHTPSRRTYSRTHTLLPRYKEPDSF